MTYTSDQQLAAAGLRRVEDLPSRPGFPFMGVYEVDGKQVEVYSEVHAYATPERKLILHPGVPNRSRFVAWRPA